MIQKVSVLSALLEAEIEAGALNDVLGPWDTEDRAWIRAEAWRHLSDGEDPPRLRARHTVRRLVVLRDQARLLEELRRAGSPLTHDGLRAALDDLGARLGALSQGPFERVAGVAVLRWAADGKQARWARELMAAALGKARNTLDAYIGQLWGKLFEASPLARCDPWRLLWHFYDPAPGDLDSAHDYLAACFGDERCVAHEARELAQTCRARNDKLQRDAAVAWREVVHALDRCIRAGSEAERALFDWADAHLVAEQAPKPIRERTLSERLYVYARRPDAEGRAALRRALERARPLLPSFPDLVREIDGMDEIARAADAARAEWSRALSKRQRALEETSPGFVQTRDTFLRSLADAHGRSAKG